MNIHEEYIEKLDLINKKYNIKMFDFDVMISFKLIPFSKTKYKFHCIARKDGMIVLNTTTTFSFAGYNALGLFSYQDIKQILNKDYKILKSTKISTINTWYSEYISAISTILEQLSLKYISIINKSIEDNYKLFSKFKTLLESDSNILHFLEAYETENTPFAIINKYIELCNINKDELILLNNYLDVSLFSLFSARSNAGSAFTDYFYSMSKEAKFKLSCGNFLDLKQEEQDVLIKAAEIVKRNMR